MVARRSDKIASIQGFLEEVLAAPIDWPDKTVNLERDSLTQYRQRPMTGDPSIAELYHENSKLSPRLLPQLRAAKQDLGELREAFLHRRSVAVQGSGLENLLPLGRLADLLRTSVSADSADLYAVEVSVIQHGIHAVHEPRSGVLQIVKRLSPPELDALSEAIRLTAPPNLPAPGGIYIVLVGNFARNEILLGVRGYRRTLIEAGRVAQRIIESATHLGVAAWPVYEFFDRGVDAVLELDGTERGALIAFEITGEM
jgi:hypothetical protein